jgi:RNA polymerase sigma-70 factor (sigma-E family)
LIPLAQFGPPIERTWRRFPLGAGNPNGRSHVDENMGVEPAQALVLVADADWAPRRPSSRKSVVSQVNDGLEHRDELTEHRERVERRERDEWVSRLFDEHYKGLCRLAGLLLGDSAAAEEVVQEAFLRTFSGWWRVRYPERAQWYLRKSVVNLCRSRLRRRGTEERGNRVTWADTASRTGADSSDLKDDAMMLVEHVRRLPPRQRDAVILRYYEDLPEAEIARTMGCAVGTVKSQLAKARATLARALEEDGAKALRSTEERDSSV